MGAGVLQTFIIEKGTVNVNGVEMGVWMCVQFSGTDPQCVQGVVGQGQNPPESHPNDIQGFKPSNLPCGTLCLRSPIPGA